jgi:hypothetical protein
MLDTESARFPVAPDARIEQAIDRLTAAIKKQFYAIANEKKAPVFHRTRWPVDHGERNCDNSRCGRELAADHVTMTTTRHVRHFCSVECITEGNEATMQAAAEYGARSA